VINYIIHYLKSNKNKIIKFLLVGTSAAAINLLLMFILVHYLGFNTRLKENIANLISMEISIIYNFIFSRNFTWNNVQKEKGMKLIAQIVAFHATVGISVLIRALLFPFLQMLGIFYLYNVIIGIGVGSVFNFFMYDNLIFKERGKAEHV